MNPSDENAPHVIRLHGPWEFECGVQNEECGLDRAGDHVNGQKSARVKVPLKLKDWLQPDFRGTVVLERAFGLPTNLDEEQSIQLVLQTDRLTLDSVSLNGIALPLAAVAAVAALASERDLDGDSNGPTPHRHEITSILQARNRLRLTLTVQSKPAGGLSDAAIEIVQR